MAVNGGVISSPVNIGDPYTALGVSPSGDYNVGEPVYSKGDVRKWSFCKPVVADKVGVMAIPDDFYLVNDGFSFVTYNNPASAIQAAMLQTDGNWAYNRPQNNLHWARLADWDGYDHSETESWFDLSMTKVGDTIGVRTRRRGSVVWEFPQKFKTTESWHGAKTEVYSVGLIFQKKGTSAVGTAIFYRFGNNLEVSDGEEYDMTFSEAEAMAAMDAGRYYVIPAITTYMGGGRWQTLRSDSQFGVWWAFPPTNLAAMAVYTVASAVTSSLDNVSVELDIVGYEAGALKYNFEEINITLMNSGAALNGVEVAARWKNYAAIQPPGTGGQFLSQRVDLPAEGSVDMYVSFSKMEEGFVSVDFVERVEIEVTLTHGGEERVIEIVPFG